MRDIGKQGVIIRNLIVYIISIIMGVIFFQFYSEILRKYLPFLNIYFIKNFLEYLAFFVSFIVTSIIVYFYNRSLIKAMLMGAISFLVTLFIIVFFALSTLGH